MVQLKQPPVSHPRRLTKAEAITLSAELGFTVKPNSARFQLVTKNGKQLLRGVEKCCGIETTTAIAVPSEVFI